MDFPTDKINVTESSTVINLVMISCTWLDTCHYFVQTTGRSMLSVLRGGSSICLCCLDCYI